MTDLRNLLPIQRKWFIVRNQYTVEIFQVSQYICVTIETKLQMSKKIWEVLKRK